MSANPINTARCVVCYVCCVVSCVCVCVCVCVLCWYRNIAQLERCDVRPEVVFSYREESLHDRIRKHTSCKRRPRCSLHVIYAGLLAPGHSREQPRGLWRDTSACRRTSSLRCRCGRPPPTRTTHTHTHTHATTQAVESSSLALYSNKVRCTHMCVGEDPTTGQGKCRAHLLRGRLHLPLSVRAHWR